MMLDERLIIRGPIDGPEIARAFREAGMPVRITQTTNLESLVAANGKIGDVKALLHEEISQIEKLREDLLNEEGNEETDPEEDGETDLRCLYNPFLDIVNSVADDIAGFMEKYQPGDVVSITDLKEWMTSPAGEATEEELPEGALPDARKTLLHKLMAFATLCENGLIKDEDEENMVVQRHMNPDDLIITIPGEATEDIDPEILKDHNIKMEMTAFPVPEYLLEFGLEAILEGDLDKIEEIADDLEIDEEDYISFRESISLKKIVIGRTLEILEEHGALTPAGIAEILGGSAIEDLEDGYDILLTLTPEFVKGLLNDLKKVGLVRKKGEKFRAI
ncbi:MAG TPA: hypothetical protein PK739_11170 [Methanoculleus sp.]|nr:hypothetical protein [Methanoculleus sp.]